MIALKPALGFAVRPGLANPSGLSSHEPEVALRRSWVRTPRDGLRPVRRTTGACVVPRTLTRSRGEVRHPTPGELRAVLWAILRKVEAGKIQKKSGDRLGRSKLTALSCVCPWSPITEPP